MKLYKWQDKIVQHEGNVTIRGGRQDGKSLAVAHRIYKLAIQFPKSRHLIIAASERQENYLYERVCDLIGKNYKGRKTLKRVELKNGTIIFKFPVGQTGMFLEGLHSIDFLHADEAIHINRRVWDSILPMLAEPRNRGLGWITLLSATKGKPTGYFRESFERKDFLQIHIKSEDCPHISKEFLKEEKERLGETMYGVIYNGEFSEEGFKYFLKKDILKATKIKSFSKKDINPRGIYIMGIDPAKYGKSKTGIAEAEIIKDGAKLVYGEELTKNSWKEQRAKILELQNSFKNKKIFFDNNGMGQGYDEFLEEEKTLKRKLVGLNNTQKGKDFKVLKEDLYSNVAKLLASEKLEIADQKELIDGLLGVEITGAEGDETITGTDMSEAIIRALWGTKDKYIKPTIITF